MARITTIVITLSDEDRATKGGLHILGQMVAGYLAAQFELSAAIRIEDERGETITEWVPASPMRAPFIDALTPHVAVTHGTAIGIVPPGMFINSPDTWESDKPDPSIAGLIGN